MNSAARTSIAIMLIHAPSPNFVAPIITATTAVDAAPTAFTVMLVSSQALAAEPVHDHATLRKRERHEHPERVQRDQPVHVGIEDGE